MLIVHADLHAKPGEGAEIARIAQPLIAATQKEDGCHFYNLFQDTTDELLFRFVEGWESKEHLGRHVKTEHFLTYFPQLTAHADRETDIKSYELK